MALIIEVQIFKPRNLLQLAVVVLAMGCPTVAQVASTMEQPQNAQVYFDKALAMRDQGQLKEAVEAYKAYKAGLRLNPKARSTSLN